MNSQPNPTKQNHTQSTASTPACLWIEHGYLKFHLHLVSVRGSCSCSIIFLHLAGDHWLSLPGLPVGDLCQGPLLKEHQARRAHHWGAVLRGQYVTGEEVGKALPKVEQRFGPSVTWSRPAGTPEGPAPCNGDFRLLGEVECDRASRVQTGETKYHTNMQIEQLL